MKLACKTRNMRTPQGLPRVWFCAHPCDYEKYLEALSADVLGAVNCAIWYDENPSDAYNADELYETLESINLLLVPVTRNLISSESRASGAEFEYAIKNHIPILPILTEPGLEDDFNRRFGELQMLNRTNTDSHAVSYAEKLVNFLSETLIDEEMSEKIRAAFDAYIFLSYRKKDRKYARELMHLIHKNDFCRDVAIWYDEYLLPGEKFNDSIKKAIDNSQLFVLNVTPSILEKTTDGSGNECDNYVLATEYPLALASKKTVLPAEMLKTDKSELEKSYKELPPCIDVHDSSALSEHLLCAFDKIALRKNDKDPQHNFFIGLAYLNGIDVEKDHELAVSLITSAADSGITQAIEKLVYMYQNGEGVARDTYLEESWRRRLIEHRAEQFNQSRDAWDAHMWLREIMCLGDLFMRTRQYQSAEREYEHAESIAKDLCTEFDNPLAQQDLSSAIYRLGFLEETQGNLIMAARLYDRSINISESFTRKSNSFLVKRDYARDVIAIARLFEANEDYASAKDSYMKAYDILSDVCAKNDFEFLRADLAYLCARIGCLERKLGRTSTAKEYYLEALELHRRNAYMSDVEPSMRKATSDLVELGDLFRSEGDACSANECYLEAIEAYIILSDKARSSPDLEELALLYCKLASVAEEDEAILALKKSLAVYEELHNEYPENTFYAECVEDITEGLSNL